MEKESYRIEISDDEFAVYDKDGVEASQDVYEWLAENFNYKLKSDFKCMALYFAESDGYTKIGVTKDIKRRECELNINIYHWIECTAHTVYRLEKELHNQLIAYQERDAKIGNEWFNFQNRNGEQLLAALQCINTEDELAAVLRINTIQFFYAMPSDVEDQIKRELRKARLSPADIATIQQRGNE